MYRAESRAPIPDDHVQYLERLGTELEQMRCSLGLTAASVADAAFLSKSHVRRLERACRRTRLSTLERIAAAFELLADPDDGVRSDEVLRRLVEAAGPSLAPESPWRERIERRGRRRARRRALVYVRKAK